MKHVSIFAAAFAALILIGQGCFGGGTTNTSDGGLWQSTDFGESWTQRASLPQVSGVTSIAGVNALDIEIDPNDPQVYYMGTAQNGLFYSLDGARSWERPRQTELHSGAISHIQVHPTNSCVIYAVRGREVIWSNDCARSWKNLYTQQGAEITAMAVDWFNTEVMWLGTSEGDVLKSLDAGQNWGAVRRITDGISAIEISNADSRIVMVGTDDKGLHYTQDAGATWVEYEDELKREYRNSDEVLGFSQSEDGSVTAMLTTYGILLSRDAGVTWEGLDLVTAPGEVTIWDVEVDPNNSNILYYGVQGTLYVSDTQGQSWTTRQLPSRRAPIDIESHEGVDGLLLTGFAVIED